MVDTGAIYTGATLIVLVYSLYASYLFSWKFNAGPLMYWFIFVCSFLLLRLAVSPVIDLWARGQSTIQTVATAEDPQMNADTCSALFTDPSTGDLMDAMTGYKSEPSSGRTCPAGFVPMPSATNPGQTTDPNAAETPLPTGSSFFHYCTAAPAAPSRVSVRSFAPTSQAQVQAKQTTPSDNRFTFYSEY